MVVLLVEVVDGNIVDVVVVGGGWVVVDAVDDTLITRVAVADATSSETVRVTT